MLAAWPLELQEAAKYSPTIWLDREPEVCGE